MSTENDVQHPVSKATAANAWIDKKTYDQMYAESIKDPVGFWDKQGQCIDWMKPYSKVKDCSFSAPDVHVKWYEDGVLNASVNCLDRHLDKKRDQIAIRWEGDNPEERRTLTYGELHAEVCKFSNVLKSLGVKKGDRVTIYLPMIPEASVAMLACARIGAIHSIVFGGFSAEALASRIIDCQAKILITADEGYRRGGIVPFKKNADEALCKQDIPAGQKVVVIKRSGGDIPWQEGRDHWYHTHMAGSSEECAPEPMNAEDPLFILYTSGSTGKPKGVLHTTGGYMVYAALTFKYIFDYKEGELYWCTADVGWVTGHTYLVYGPMANGASCMMFEGVPDYPDYSRFWQIVERYKVNIFYTAPTAIRSLMRHGDAPVTKHNLTSLRILGSVGEPIDPHAWDWYHRIVGQSKCPIVDTWWQTETGGIVLSPLPGATALKPGSVAKPFFGIEAAIVDKKGTELSGVAQGCLVLKGSWPGQMRTVFRNHQRFADTYFIQYPGKFFSGDGARRDKDGYYWITGRTDDVINVAGHRLGTAEVESAVDSYLKVAESAVVGFPHEVKGQGIYVFVTLIDGEQPSEALKNQLKLWVREKLGPVALPDYIQWADGLPKTRSGKIMRRILRSIAAGKHQELGDISTLADPSVVEELLKNSLHHAA